MNQLKIMNEIAEFKQGEPKTSVMVNGTKTKALYVKHLSLDDWKLVELLQERYRITAAEVVRVCIRKTFELENNV